MDGSSEGDEEGMPQEPTVASILGIRGPLRFRAHGSTQKAHVVLRQIELSDESGDEGDGSSMVYFSLFAQKRIEVKPGKEILLAVASPDGRHMDTPVILTGSIVDKKVIETLPPPPQTPVAVEPPKPAVYTMPPRMRKAWPGQNGVGQTGSRSFGFPPSKSTSYTSVGVQCQVSTTSCAVETDPEPVRPLVSSGIQAVEPPRITHAKDTQTDVAVISYHDGTVQTVLDLPTTPAAAVAITPLFSPNEVEDNTSEYERERSLSPMELDSAPSSPTLSPAIVPAKPSTPSDGRGKSMSYSPRTFSLPELSISTANTPQTLATTEARISPLHLSPNSGDAPGLAITPEIIAFHKTFTPPVDRTNLHLPSPKSTGSSQQLQHDSHSESLPGMTTPSSPFVAIVASSPSTPAIAEKRTQDLPQSQIVHTPYVPKRKAVPFPFVSGGYLKDFVTTPTQPELAMQSSVHKEPESQSQDTSSTVRLAALPQTPAPAPALAPSTPAPPTLLPSPPLPPPPPTEPSRASPPPPPPPQARTKAATPPSNHAASSSKVKVEDIPPSGVANDARDIASRPSNSEYDPSPAPPKARAAPPQPSYFRSPVAPYPPYIPRSQPGAIPRTKPGFIPAVPARALHPSLTATFPSAWQPWQRAEEPSPPRSPPPAPKVIAHIPSGSYSNPLNIQPARAVPLSSRVPEAGSVNVQSPAGSKKPVVVGNGWPYNTRSHAKANAASTNGTARTQPAKTPVSDAAAVATPTPEALSGSGAPSTSAHSPTPPTTGEPAPSTTPQPDQSGKSGPPALRVSLSGVTSYQNVYVSGPGPAAASTSSSSSTPAPAPAPRLTPTPTATTPSHPLPPKPPAFTGTAAGSYSPRRGVKRMVSPTPLAPDSKVKTDFAWATGDPVHCVRIKADGDAGIRTITFNSDGTQFAIACWDKSVRIWNRRSRQEIAKLGHNMQVIAVAWMDHDSGVITLGDNGILSTWTRNAQNKWMWAKLLDVNAGRQMKESPSCLAFVKDRIAIALPTEGVKVWTFMKGTWINQRSIGRQKVTALKFVDEGEALVGGTEDGTLWHCEVPNGTLKALKIFTKAPISSLETDVRGQIGLTTLADGRCELVNVRLDANKGSVEQSFTVKDMELPGPFTHTFGAVFVSSGQSVVHGSVRGCVMVWDRSAGDVVYGLKHGEEDSVNTVSSFNGTANLAGLILTGTRSGQLTWFTHPPTDAGPNRKRVKI